jgi:hypothetical protein
MTPWVIGNFSKSHVAFRSGGLTLRAADEWARRAFFEYCSDLGAIPLSILIPQPPVAQTVGRTLCSHYQDKNQYGLV